MGFCGNSYGDLALAMVDLGAWWKQLGGKLYGDLALATTFRSSHLVVEEESEGRSLGIGKPSAVSIVGGVDLSGVVVVGSAARSLAVENSSLLITIVCLRCRILAELRGESHVNGSRQALG